MKKQKLKQFTSVLLAVVMLISIIPQVSVPTEAIPGAVYQGRRARGAGDLTASSNLNYAESEHFRLYFGQTAVTAAVTNSEYVTGVKLDGSGWTGIASQANQITNDVIIRTLRNYEICYDVYVAQCGYKPPAQSRTASQRAADGGDNVYYKMNVIIFHTGIGGFSSDAGEWQAWAGLDGQGYPYMGMCAASLGNNSAAIPHELFHCIVFANGWVNNNIVGPWHEAMANYGRDIVCGSDKWRAMAGNNNMGDTTTRYFQNMALQPAHPRAYYQAWPILTYLTALTQQDLAAADGLTGYENKEIIPYLLANANNNEPLFESLDRFFPDADMKDTIGHFAKRLATYDISPNRKTVYTNAINNYTNSQAGWQQIYTVPEATGKPNTYAVPTDRAPQPAGINLIPLTLTAAAGQPVSVTLKGLTALAGADWRFAIAIQNQAGDMTYSNLAKPGETATVTVPANVSKAFVSVAATPSNTAANFLRVGFVTGNTSEANMSYVSKQRYPYEITLTGADRMLQRNATANGNKHPNGGGTVATSAQVAATVYVGPNARVLGNARVSGNAVIDGYAIVEGNAQVSGNAVVDGFANVKGNVQITENAHVTDRVVMEATSRASGYAKVMGSAWMLGSSSATGNAVVQGMAEMNNNSSVTGQGIADGDYFVDGAGFTHSQGQVAGYNQPASYFSGRPYTDGLHMGYAFGTSNKTSLIMDRYHSTYAAPYGITALEGTRTSANGVLTLNGTDQYVNLNRAASFFNDFEIQTAVLWRGGASDQKIFHFGDKDNYMYLTPSNADGKAEFVIKKGATTQRLTANAALPLGRWVIISVGKTENDGSLEFNVGGAIGGNTAAAIPTVSSNAMSLKPADISNNLTNSAVYSLGRDTDGNFFNGSYDFFDIFYKAAPAPTYSYTATEDIPNPVSYNITFDYNYTGAPANLVQPTETTGKLSALPTIPAREGYTFAGWFNAITGGTEITADTIFTANVTVYARWTQIIPPPLLNGILFKDVDVLDTANREEWFVQDNLQNGDKIFGCYRDFTFADLPDGLKGAERLQPSGNSKALQTDVATFTAGEYMDLYVALDSRVVGRHGLPAWLESYKKTELTAATKDAQGLDIVFEIYKRTFTKGAKITLGTNGPTYGVMMYAVFAKAIDHIIISSANANEGWLELSNPTNRTLSCRGLFLSNSEDKYEWQIPSMIISAGETVRVRDEDNTKDAVHKRMQTNFDIEQGEVIILYDASGTIFTLYEVD